MSNAWLHDHLVAQGHISPTGSSRRAVPRRCNGCNQPIIVGDDDVTCSLEVHADPVPLSPLGEALALLDGRRTLTLNHEAGRYVLNVRYDLQIQRHPAGSRLGEDVLRSHRCRTDPVPKSLQAPSMHPAARVVSLPANSPAPF